ncbi:MAG: hypothetical protein ACE5KE_01805 [Methanosarcinales archaeon]
MPILVPTHFVDADKSFGRTINSLMEIFVHNEMKQRRIPEFRAVIIEIFDDERKPKVYLNEEAQFILTLKNRMLTKNNMNKVISLDLKEIKSIEWNDKVLDKNSAKVFIIRWSKDYWILEFDFRYNKEIAESKMMRAKEFLNAAKKLNVNEDFNVMIYLLWSCAELIIDSKLYLMPGQKPNTTHKDRKNKLQSFEKSSIFSEDFTHIFSLLSKEKNKARYGGKVNKGSINEKFIARAITILEEEINSLLL